MAIGVKVDPTVLVAGSVIALRERRAYVSDEDRAKGVLGDVTGHEAIILQEAGSQLLVRFPARGEQAAPAVGEYVALEASVSEGTFRDREGTERGYVNLVAARPAFNALDLIQSNFSKVK